MKLRLLPLLVFGAMAALILFNIATLDEDQFAAGQIQTLGEFSASPLVLPRDVAQASDKEGLPSFLPGFSSDELRAIDGPILVNIFASWCIPCRGEHQYLEELQLRGAKIYGVNYRDRASAAWDFLQEFGVVYEAVNSDSAGSIAIELGIFGVPETFLVEGGIIKHRYIGPIDAKLTRELIARLSLDG